MEQATQEKELTYDEFINNILTTRGRFACGDEYHETHHIVPKCMGGTDDDDNLIDLFAREHFEAHRLLALENPDVQGLTYAWWCMCQCPGSSKKRYEVTPEEYEEARITRIKTISGENHPNFGKHLSDEIKDKISKSHIGKQLSDSAKKAISHGHIGIFAGEKHPMYGKHHTEETKNKLRNAFSGENNHNYGKQMSEEQRQKISQTKKEKYKKENHHMFGKHHSKNTKKKISESLKGLQSGKDNPRARKVCQYDKDNNLIKIWDYIKQAADELKIQPTSIVSCCTGKLKTAGGFIWRYTDEETI